MTTQVTGSGINFNGATSGTILLTQPAVAGSNTITLPAETGTARTTVSSGTVLQVVNYQTGAVATGTTAIPYDDTIPQNTEGTEFMSLAITPRSATSKLLIEVHASYAAAATVWTVVALFRDSVANALAAVDQYITFSGQHYPTPLSHFMDSPGTSSTTFKVRIGASSGATITLNGQGGARYMGGVMASSITITEVVP